VFYLDLKVSFYLSNEIEKNFDEQTGLYGSEYNNKLHIVSYGVQNVAKIILDGLKMYFKIPISEDIYKSYYEFEMIVQNHQTKIGNPAEEKKEHKKLAEKWYALLLWIKLTANGERPQQIAMDVL
jgi:hypothetical protein